jgi:hypothetical protein
VVIVDLVLRRINDGDDTEARALAKSIISEYIESDNHMELSARLRTPCID